MVGSIRHPEKEVLLLRVDLVECEIDQRHDRPGDREASQSPRWRGAIARLDPQRRKQPAQPSLVKEAALQREQTPK
jgi:hypothetical protein